MNKIAVFASGQGTNTQSIIDYFKESESMVALIISNQPQSFVLKRAQNMGIPSLLINKESFYSGQNVVNRLLSEKIDLIVCAGFLWKIPNNILEAFPGKIVNVHPSLLPKFGGKGMYGVHVHKAVIDSGETESGITIHFLNEHYDEGKIITQKKCRVEKTDTYESLAQKIQALEHEWYPKMIEKVLKKV